MNRHHAERVIQLIKVQANNFSEMERNMVALARALECLFDIDSEPSWKAPQSDDKPRPTFLDPHDPRAALEVLPGATAGISGKTLTVVSEVPPTSRLSKRFPDGGELWEKPCSSSNLTVMADNKWMVNHPSDATEELIERLHEDHGV